MLRVITIFALLSALAMLSQERSWANTPELRQAWREARAQIQAGREPPSMLRDLGHYALYPYLEAATIINGLHRPEQYTANIEAAEAFIVSYADTAIELNFRRDLLFALSELQAWEDFVRFYSQEAANESRQCEYLRARVELRQTTDLAPLVVQRWLTARRLNAACEPAFQWLRQTGVLGEALIAERLELLLDAGQTQFARIIANRLPAEDAQGYRQWSQMLDTPIAAIDAVIAGTSDVALPAALRATWARASTATPSEAYTRLPGLLAATAENTQEANRFIRDLALGLAWDRRSEALEVFAQLGKPAHDDYSRGWLVRSALWNGEPAVARESLAAMSASAQQDSAWTYWRARTDELLGDVANAHAAFDSLLGRDNFYSAAAAARLGIEVTPREAPIEVSEELVSELSENAGFVRARELFLLNERVMATREWNFATAGLDSARLAAAVVLANEWQWHDMAVLTATRADIYFDYSLLFPRPFAGEIARAASTHGLDQELLSGLVRQESMFRPDAVSTAGAIGLTQLGLSTARITARQHAMPPPSRNDLFEPATNTLLGAATLRERLAIFGEQLPVALAAYNAGPAAARRWLPQEPLDSDVWIENIPYNETREYVRRVLWNSIVYEWLGGSREPVDSRFLLGTVAAPADDG